MLKIFLLFLLSLSLSANDTIGPSDVYYEVSKLLSEVRIVKTHLGITQPAQVVVIKTPLFPRHSLSLTYEIFIKINILREKESLSVVPITSTAPVTHVDPMIVYEQIRRLLSEMVLLKQRLGITQQIEAPPQSNGKNPQDVFNALLRVSGELDIINGTSLNSSYTFAEVMRIYEEINTLYSAMSLEDMTQPVANNSEDTLQDAYQSALELLSQVQRLQRKAAIATIDTTGFKILKIIDTSELFMITEVIITELQTLKSVMGLHNSLTPLANHYEGKTPSDVNQMLQWCVHRLEQVSILRLE